MLANYARGNGGRTWQRGLPMAFLLALHFLLTIEATERMVGGSWGWGSPKDEDNDGSPDQDFYQKWSDQYSWVSGDVLVFVYNYPTYDVIVFPSESTFEACDSRTNLLEYDNETSLQLNGSGTVYFGTHDSYCYSGMKFSVTSTDLTEPPTSSTSSPPDLNASPPPPSSTRRQPPNPRGVSSPPPSKKSSSAAVYALVPILVLLAIGAGVGGWFVCKRHKQRLQFQAQAQQQAYAAQYPNPPMVNLAGFTPQHQREQTFDGSGFLQLPKGAPHNNFRH